MAAPNIIALSASGEPVVLMTVPSVPNPMQAYHGLYHRLQHQVQPTAQHQSRPLDLRQLQASTHFQPQLQPQPQNRPRFQVQSQGQPHYQPLPLPQRQTHPQDQPQVRIQPQFRFQAQAHAQALRQLQSQAQAQAQAEASQARAQAQAQQAREAQAQAQLQSQSRVLQAQAQAQSQSQAQSQADPQAQTYPSEARQDRNGPATSAPYRLSSVEVLLHQALHENQTQLQVAHSKIFADVQRIQQHLLRELNLHSELMVRWNPPMHAGANARMSTIQKEAKELMQGVWNGLREVHDGSQGRLWQLLCGAKRIHQEASMQVTTDPVASPSLHAAMVAMFSESLVEEHDVGGSALQQTGPIPPPLRSDAAPVARRATPPPSVPSTAALYPDFPFIPLIPVPKREREDDDDFDNSRLFKCEDSDCDSPTGSNGMSPVGGDGASDTTLEEEDEEGESSSLFALFGENEGRRVRQRAR
ncbi:hypothetical protein A4X13_0g4841 [Tilletia indica]|uniref:Uncharacterized protein n=1 Tax=Tilletia indica TaxID=43049 RepID=A0A8T8SW48_9BASI|nr:hypothetical protein A4X13_0g4841 [Tilletia indica]